VLDPVWSLVIASAIAVIGGVFAYKQFVSKLVESSSAEELSRRGQEFSRFVIKFAIIEAVPILLLAYALFQITSGMGVSTDATLPLVAVLLIALFGLLSVYFTTSQILQDPRSAAGMKNHVTSLMMVSASLIHTIPLVSLLVLFLVMLGML